jgi:hypothetical protein
MENKRAKNYESKANPHLSVPNYTEILFYQIYDVCSTQMSGPVDRADCKSRRGWNQENGKSPLRCRRSVERDTRRQI